MSMAHRGVVGFLRPTSCHGLSKTARKNLLTIDMLPKINSSVNSSARQSPRALPIELAAFVRASIKMSSDHFPKIHRKCSKIRPSSEIHHFFQSLLYCRSISYTRGLGAATDRAWGREEEIRNVRKAGPLCGQSPGQLVTTRTYYVGK